MKVLGLSATYRPMGNSEILTKEALMGAEEAGADVELIRLKKLKFQDCRGCALCLFRNQECHLKDDLVFLFDKMRESDGIILGTPCYILEATSLVKRIIDRSFYHFYLGDLRGKSAGVVVSYATRGWTTMVFPQTSGWLKGLGMHIIDRALFHCQYPAEVLLRDSLLERAHAVGRNVAEAISSGDTTFKGEKGLCPVCYDSLIRIRPDGKTVECPLCQIEGTLEIRNGNIEVSFDEKAAKNHRFSPDNIADHFTYHIKPSKDHFLRTMESVEEKKARYKNYPPAPAGRT